MQHFPKIFIPWLMILSIVGTLHAQVLPNMNTKEKRPSPKSPDASNPMLSPQLRKMLEEGGELPPEFQIGTSGKLDMESYLQSQKKKKQEEKKREHLLWEKTSEDIPDEDERYLLEKSVMQQFGTEQFVYQSHHRAPYRETALRRFQIIYFLALPITLAGSYGLLSAYKNTQGESARVFNGPETAAMLLLGGGLAGAVAWWDLLKWQEMNQAREEEIQKISALPTMEGRTQKHQQHAGTLLSEDHNRAGNQARIRSTQHNDAFPFTNRGEDPLFHIRFKMMF